MRTIIAGSRTITDYALVEAACRDCGWPISEVVSGKQRSIDHETGKSYGADYLGECWAAANKIPIRAFPANWQEFGRAAGPIRNKAMSEYAHALICIHNGSRGSADMLRRARALGLRIHEVRI